MDKVFAKYPNKYFVETGCYIGDGIQSAINAGFDNIISIEISPKFSTLCEVLFKNNENVKIIRGDSSIILSDVISSIKEPITFWLDAHLVYDPKVALRCLNPLLLELEAIKVHKIKTHTILIDDLRLWGKQINVGFGEEDLKQKILEINSNYQFFYEEGTEPNDILAAVVK